MLLKRWYQRHQPKKDIFPISYIEGFRLPDFFSAFFVVSTESLLCFGTSLVDFSGNETDSLLASSAASFLDLSAASILALSAASFLALSVASFLALSATSFCNVLTS